MLDAMGERYGMLPTEVLAKGSTHDLSIFQTAMQYRDQQNRKANKQAPAFTDAQIKAKMEEGKKLREKIVSNR